MSGLISDLQQAAQALSAQQLALQVTGNNLANVNNASYSRQVVTLGTPGLMNLPEGEISMGVTATGISQIRNKFLDAQVTREISASSVLQSQYDELQQAQSALGEQVSSTTSTSSIDSTQQSTTGISAALSNFFNAANGLSASPTDTSAKQTLFQTATTLANTINTADSNLQSVQSDLTTQVAQDTSTVNGLLQNIATLNGQIQTYEIGKPGSANDLRDQRQADLEQLAGYMNFTATEMPGEHGQIQVTTLDSNSNPVVLVDKASVQGAGVQFTGTGFTGGNPASALGFSGGSLQGDLTVRDSTIQTLRDNLATTANQLTAAVNKAYNPTGATGNFFQATPATGSLLTLDSTLSVNSMKTTDTGSAGANELALAVAQVGSQTFSTSSGDAINGTIGGFYSQTVTGLGESIDGLNSQLTDQTTVQQMVQTQRDAVSGVNQDEELTNLMTYQRAYQAQARMITTLDDCLNVVVNGLFGGAF